MSLFSPASNGRSLLTRILQTLAVSTAIRRDILGGHTYHGRR
jgi:hypothetical protein